MKTIDERIESIESDLIKLSDWTLVSAEGEIVGDRVLRLRSYVGFDGEIYQIYVKSLVGTCTIRLRINGTNVTSGGVTDINVTTVGQLIVIDGSNSLSVGDSVEIERLNSSADLESFECIVWAREI